MEIFDQHVLDEYRSLLDQEETAFDELEHAFEEGDRVSFEKDFQAWKEIAEKRTHFLSSKGIITNHSVVSDSVFKS